MKKRIFFLLFAWSAAGAWAFPPAVWAEDDAEGGEIGRAALWSSRCAQCHNLPSPSFYDAAHWDVVMLHMKSRAYLTREEYEKISEFLEASSG
jgi:hypothetical protein